MSPLAIYSKYLGGIPCLSLLAYIAGSGIIPSDLFLGTPLTGHVPHCVHKCQYNKNLLSWVISRSPFLSKIWEIFCKGSRKHLFLRLLGNMQSSCDRRNQILDSWQAASALLAQASLLPFSWYQQCRQPDWTPSWCSACVPVPGSCSWSIRTLESNSAASPASGSLGVQYRRRWLGLSDDTNLGLVVLGRLSQPLRDLPLLFCL
jgi:hypothetical protein